MSYDSSISIIRHRGRVTEAIFHGYRVTRQDRIVARAEGQLNVSVPCTPYDEHFIFEKPPQLEGVLLGPCHYCTCGSTAEIARYGTPEATWVCTMHAVHGFHQTSIVNQRDFDQHAAAAKRGEVLIPQKRGRAWE